MTARTRISASIAAAHEEDALRQLLQSGRLIGSVTTSGRGSGFGFRLPVRLEAFGTEFVRYDPRCGGRVEGSAPLPQGRIAGDGGWTNVGLIPLRRPIVSHPGDQRGARPAPIPWSDRRLGPVVT